MTAGEVATFFGYPPRRVPPLGEQGRIKLVRRGRGGRSNKSLGNRESVISFALRISL